MTKIEVEVDLYQMGNTFYVKIPYKGKTLKGYVE